MIFPTELMVARMGLGPNADTTFAPAPKEPHDLKEAEVPSGAPAEPTASDAGRREPEMVNHPRHYNSHPSGIECIDVVEHMSFNIGNAMKYLWRADEKGAAVQDLHKAVWYIQQEIKRKQKAIILSLKN
ncbi:MAG: DUF3310 domain-containing protein [Burkholderiales bacterium]